MKKFPYLFLLAFLLVGFFNSTYSKTVSYHNNNSSYTSTTYDQDNVLLDGYRFKLVEVVNHPNNTSTWTYSVIGEGARRNLSRWKLELFPEHNVLNASPCRWSVNSDSHFSHYGIKWKRRVRKNGCVRLFSLTLDGHYNVGIVNFGYLSGCNVYEATIAGPTTPLAINISGLVYNDHNQSVQRDDGEEGFENITLQLYNDANNNNVIDVSEELLDTVVTDIDGEYVFEEVAATNVIVKVITPNDTAAYEYLITSSETIKLNMDSEDIEDVDFGMIREDVGPTYFRTSGVIWNDSNANGIFDTDETALNNLTVEVYVDTNNSGVFDFGDTLVAFTESIGEEGTYIIGNPNYVIDEVPEGLVFIKVVIPPPVPPLLVLTPTFDYDTGSLGADAIVTLNIQAPLDGVNFGIYVYDIFTGNTRVADKAKKEKKDILEELEQAKEVLETEKIFEEETTSNIERVAPLEASVYPNPATDIINISSKVHTKTMDIAIYDMVGDLVLKSKVEALHNTSSVNIQHLKHGMYLLLAATNEHTITKKFIKK